MKRYNFWGVTREDQKEHRFYKLSIFKRGFGGSDLEYLHAQNLVISRIGYLKNWNMEITVKEPGTFSSIVSAPICTSLKRGGTFPPRGGFDIKHDFFLPKQKIQTGFYTGYWL